MNDFDKNTLSDKVFSRTIDGRPDDPVGRGKDVPVFLKREFTDALPPLKKENLKHHEFAKKTIQTLFDPVSVRSSTVKTFNYSNNVIAWNEGNGKFTIMELTATPEFNMFKYMYFYNGAGVGVGDFNNDGLSDIFFSSNQGENKIYLNEGGMKFKDVTKEARIPQDGGWSTGVSVVDINNDGLLDIYVCRVGNYETLQSKNQFLICKGKDANGVPYYEDEAGTLGLAFSGFGTQAAFFDYDLDGDLDFFLINHSLRFNGTFNERSSYLNTFDTLAADYLFRNESPSGGGKGEVKFVDVSATAGINRSIIGYGLGLSVADINLDGYPDLYIGNDFQENDYLYINQKNGTFIDS
ncbi:MAG: VCBS repeat-containing protein, partial [Bacteroidetes bacterium]